MKALRPDYNQIAIRKAQEKCDFEEFEGLMR